MTTMRLETDRASCHVTTYVHANILNPGPNRSKQPSAFRGVFFALSFEAAVVALVLLARWAYHVCHF